MCFYDNSCYGYSFSDYKIDCWWIHHSYPDEDVDSDDECRRWTILICTFGVVTFEHITRTVCLNCWQFDANTFVCYINCDTICYRLLLTQSYFIE